MKYIKHILIFAVFAGFLIFAILTVRDAMPQSKEARIYKLIHAYSPYQLEKRFGGLSIINKNSDKKEKPPSSLVLHRLDDLDKQWGKDHVKVKGSDVFILDNSGKEIARISMKNQKEKDFVLNFYNSKVKNDKK